MLKTDFKMNNKRNTLAVNKDTRQYFKERKHAAIHNDFVRMVTNMVHPSVIYSKLSAKYFMDKGSIYRVILSKKNLINKKQVKDTS